MYVLYAIHTSIIPTRGIDNNWLNGNMDYDKTDSDSNNDIDYYIYNNNTNNWSILTRDKIN